MDNIGNTCIISCGIGNWYAQGIDRLERSLIFHGYAGKVLFWKDEYPPDSPSHLYNPYAFKIYAFKEAIKQGYKHILYVDASFWCVRTPHEIFDIINEKGIFCFKTGYNCAQTCTDQLLFYTKITRDEAEQAPEFAGGALGFNFDNPDAQKVFKYWEELCNGGFFNTSRNYNPLDSSDARFLHSRQDQSALSITMKKFNLNPTYADYVAYYDKARALKEFCNPEKVLFFIGGL